MKNAEMKNEEVKKVNNQDHIFERENIYVMIELFNKNIIKKDEVRTFLKQSKTFGKVIK
jgi:hypothetical protein